MAEKPAGSPENEGAAAGAAAEGLPTSQDRLRADAPEAADEFATSLEAAVEEGHREGFASAADVEAEGVAVIAAVREERAERFTRVSGMATTGLTTDQIMAIMRGNPGEDPHHWDAACQQAPVVIVAGSAPLLRLWEAGRLHDLPNWGAVTIIADEAFARLPAEAREAISAWSDGAVIADTFVGQAAARSRAEGKGDVPGCMAEVATAELLARGVADLLAKDGRLVLLIDERDGQTIIRKPAGVTVVAVQALLAKTGAAGRATR